MLIRFSLANFLSIREPQELSLVAASLKDTESGLITSPSLPKEKILPAAVIYGANASGKTNVLAAFDFMRRAVLLSHREGKPGKGVPRTPFALDPECRTANSAFDADFVVDGVRYHYGFEANSKNFDSEWLYAFPNNRRQTLFERKQQDFVFGRNLRGRNKIISEMTRVNSLFVSAAAQNGHEQLTKIMEFFETIDNDSEISIEPATAFMRLREGRLDDRIIKFLNYIGTGVNDHRKLEKPLSEEGLSFQRKLIDFMKEFAPEGLDVDSIFHERDIEIELSHLDTSGKNIYFSLRNESAGTRRLLILLNRIFTALDSGTLLLIDELDASLHTHACGELLGLFCSSDTNPKGAQIIVTTHDTNLLHHPSLRRDQIWFTEKDEIGATQLYPLSEYRTRAGDNIEKGYLEGRYGALPVKNPRLSLV